MKLTKAQKRFINCKAVGFALVKGSSSTGKTITSVYRTINLENNYCLYADDKILYITKNERENKNVVDFYEKENEKSYFYSLFSSSRDRVNISSLKEVVSSYAKSYCNGRNIKEISDIKAFEILKSEYFTEVLNEYSKKSKLISKMELEEIFNEILWIKACNFTLEEYENAIRKGRKRIIRKNSFSREFLYSLMEVYSAELMDRGYKDKYDDAIFAKKYALKNNYKYSHIIVDNVEELTRGELEFIKSIYSNKDYSSMVFVVNENRSNNENVWLIKGRKLKELGADFKGKTFNLKTSFTKESLDVDKFMSDFTYLDLRHKNIIDFKIDNSLSSDEIYLNDGDVLDKKNLEEIPVYNEIAAGNPIGIVNHVEDKFLLPKRWTEKNADLFILKVKGDSMIGKNINNGDLVVIKRQQTADHNDIVAASLNGEATLKTLKYTENDPVLMPANPKYDQIELRGKDVQILGVAIGVIKSN